MKRRSKHRRATAGHRRRLKTTRTRRTSERLRKKRGLPPKRNGKFPSYTSLGSYPLIYLTKKNEVLCGKCASNDRANADDPVVAYDAFYEGSPEHCANCNETIMSAYGDPDCAHTIGADGNCTYCGGS